MTDNNCLFEEAYDLLHNNVVHNNFQVEDQIAFSKSSRSFNSYQIIKIDTTFTIF